MKNHDHNSARRFSHVYRFKDDLIAMNDNKEFESSFKEIYSAEFRIKERKCR